MLTPIQARDMLLKKHPGTKADAYVDWKGLYVISLTTEDDFVINDAIYSVNKKTGRIKEFSPLLLPDPDEFFDNAEAVRFELS